MQKITRYLGKAAVLSATLAVVALPGQAGAQSGSAGGSIGNDEKSLSGSREAPRAVETSRPARRSKPEAEEPRRASRKSGGRQRWRQSRWSMGSYQRRLALRHLLRHGGHYRQQDGGAIRHRSSQSQWLHVWNRIRRQPDLEHVRPLRWPQRLRFVSAIRWMCRKLDRIKTVIAPAGCLAKRRVSRLRSDESYPVKPAAFGD